MPLQRIAKKTTPVEECRSHGQIMNDNADMDEQASQEELLTAREAHGSATVVKVLNTIALFASIPVWGMARRTAVRSGGCENLGCPVSLSFRRGCADCSGQCFDLIENVRSRKMSSTAIHHILKLITGE